MARLGKEKFSRFPLQRNCGRLSVPSSVLLLPATALQPENVHLHFAPCMNKPRSDTRRSLPLPPLFVANSLITSRSPSIGLVQTLKQSAHNKTFLFSALKPG